MRAMRLNLEGFPHLVALGVEPRLDLAPPPPRAVLKPRPLTLLQLQPMKTPEDYKVRMYKNALISQQVAWFYIQDSVVPRI